MYVSGNINIFITICDKKSRATYRELHVVDDKIDDFIYMANMKV